MRRARLWRQGAGVLLMLCGSAGGCREQGRVDDIERAEFGVLFGGDIQDRTHVVLERDPAKQPLGLRVTFRAPVARERLVRWEIERPSASRGPDGGTLFAAELGEARVRPGERRLDAHVVFRQADRPGTFRIRIRVDDTVILERAFQVVSTR